MKQHRIAPVPVRTPAKRRIIATLHEIARQVDQLPEEVCVLLEEARILETIRRHIGTGAILNRTMVEPIKEMIGAGSRVAAVISGLTAQARGGPRRRR